MLGTVAASLSLDGPLTDPSLLAAVECTAFNQLLVVPIVYYPLFFGITGAVQGLSPADSARRAHDMFVNLTLRNWAFWIPVQLYQFAFIGSAWHVPFTCIMGLVWNVLLSAVAGSVRTSAHEVQIASPAFTQRHDVQSLQLLLSRLLATVQQRHGLGVAASEQLQQPILGLLGIRAVGGARPQRDSRRR